MDRSILHCDMNNFYASVERLYNPDLAGKPVAVCGDREMRHGIVLAKSEEAKRCGVKTGEAIWQAQFKCPELVIVPTHFDRYVKYSRLAREIYCEYTDLVEPFGMDECWLDVTASSFAFGTGETIGGELRERIRKELGLTISVGVSFNKVFAKLGSDMKKPDAMTLLPRDAVAQRIWCLPVEEMLWIGPKSAAILHRFGIDTIGKLAQADDTFLRLKFGKLGAQMKASARGEDQSPVLPVNYEPKMKSIGHGITTPQDLTTYDQVWILIFALCQDIGEKLRFHKKMAKGVALECKDRNFFVKTLQARLSEPTDCTITIANAAFTLFRERYLFREPLRSVSVRAIDLERDEFPQLSLFTDPKEIKSQVLDHACDSIRARFGKGAIRAASLLSVSLPEEEGYIPFSAR
ncbi:MAG: DNA polymerase IV [Clostridia bacterium]|nr:DNA polymerase IV [Clostridia bacterium]